MLNIFKKLLSIISIKKNNPVYLNKKYPQYEVGLGTYGDMEVFEWGEGANLTVGSYSSIGSGVKIFLGGEHRVDWVTTYPFNALNKSARQIAGHPKTKGGVSVGSDVWIGSEALILSGVTIGHGAVVGARAVVTKDVPPYAIVAGNPAHLLKYRFSPEIIERLLKVKWWDWREEDIVKIIPNLLNDDIISFLNKAESKLENNEK